MKKTDLAYLAGLFDGEGCIHIARNKRPDCPKGVQYQLVAKVSMASEYLCHLYQMSFGGRVHRDKKYKDYHKQMWTWVVASREAQSFLSTISPYLIEKKAQAILGLKFQATKAPTKAAKGRRGFLPQSDEIKAVEEAQFLLMKNLKRPEVSQ